MKKVKVSKSNEKIIYNKNKEVLVVKCKKI
jgi:hypothetical protein